jgi:double-stranded uracil-DNA glycosylase
MVRPCEQNPYSLVDTMPVLKMFSENGTRAREHYREFMTPEGCKRMIKKPARKDSHAADEAIAGKPTKAGLLAAHGKPVRDIIAPRLKVLFVGINPGLYSGAVGHHFARPGNRFWPALHKAGFTAYKLSPFEERELLKRGCGITNIVNFSTAAADELDAQELAAGGRRLIAKIMRYRPRIVAILGLKAFRLAFGRPKAGFGSQEERIGSSRVWVLPNPSGLNASYQLPALARMFRTVRRAAEKESSEFPR